MPCIVLEWENCEECPFSGITDDGYLYCKKIGEKLGYYLDYQGKRPSWCPFTNK